MNVTTIALGLTLLILFANPFASPKPAPPDPLDESQIEVHWIQKGEPAPFDGILLNEYTYKRMRLILIEERGR